VVRPSAGTDLGLTSGKVSPGIVRGFSIERSLRTAAAQPDRGAYCNSVGRWRRSRARS